MVIEDVLNDERWRGYGNLVSEFKPFGLSGKLKINLIAICLFDENKNVIGLIRLVKEELPYEVNCQFTDLDKSKLKNFSLKVSSVRLGICRCYILTQNCHSRKY